jgi:hypothetical protein
MKVKDRPKYAWHTILYRGGRVMNSTGIPFNQKPSDEIFI